MKGQTIYLDSHATTPVDQDVLAEMLPYFTAHYANGNHQAGWKVNGAIENSRTQVANLIGARPSEIVFTSGATEAINLGLLGLVSADKSGRGHIITQRTEHAAVLECIEVLQERGFRVTVLDVDSVGRIDIEDLKAVISEDTLIVAVMLANNEIGTVQPVKEIGEVCRTHGAKFFCDFTQGIGWNDINVDQMKIDLAAMSSHKIYGPKGVGALFVRRMRPNVMINPIQFGGGQERGIRPGTSNAPGIVGFGKACELAMEQSSEVYGPIRKLRDSLQEQIFTSLDGVKLNGCPVNRHPGNLNVAIPGVSGEELINALSNVSFSTTSACTSASAKASHVLEAIQANDTELNGSFRMGIGKYNTQEEIDFVAARIVEVAKELQYKREF